MDPNSLYSVLNTAFIICLAMTILFFVISAVLFFVFDIRTIYMIRSGRAQAKTIKEMQNANAGTGRLRVGKKTQTAALKKEKVRKAEVAPPQPYNYQQPQPQMYYGSDSDRTEQLSPQNGNYASYDGSEQTTLLNPSDGSEQTTLLYSNEGSDQTTVLNTQAETSVLNRPVSAPVAQPVENNEQSAVFFEVIKKVIVCDTDEVVR